MWCKLFALTLKIELGSDFIESDLNLTGGVGFINKSIQVSTQFFQVNEQSSSF